LLTLPVLNTNLP